jgi:hypothetical protein
MNKRMLLEGIILLVIAGMAHAQQVAPTLSTSRRSHSRPTRREKDPALQSTKRAIIIILPRHATNNGLQNRDDFGQKIRGFFLSRRSRASVVFHKHTANWSAVACHRLSAP